MTPLTSIDFPGALAAVLYLQGCPWRCGYCHNPELLPARAPGQLAWEDVDAFLQRRHGLLDAVVFSGGEPTLQPALGDALARVRSLGFRTGLHSGGMYPARLQTLLPQLDWIGLDIKAPWHLYDAITRGRNSAPKVRQSLEAVHRSGITHECRTTWHPGLYPEPELHLLADTLREAGVQTWVLQECRVDGRPHPAWRTPDLERLGRGFASFSFRRGG